MVFFEHSIVVTLCGIAGELLKDILFRNERRIAT
jgi:hypothetical protein